MGYRQNCAKFQENLFRNNEIISIFLPFTFSQTAYATTKSSYGCQRDVIETLFWQKKQKLSTTVSNFIIAMVKDYHL